MNIIKIKKSILSEIIQRSVEKAILKEDLDQPKVNKKRIINAIYKAINPLTQRLYNDEYWAGVSEVKNTIGALPFVTDISVSVENGGYRTNSDNSAKWKEYKFEIQTDQNVAIYGQLNAHAAGSVQDPFDRYDITLTLW